MALSPTAKGILLMLGSNVVFCVMSCLLKYVPNIDTYKTTLFRFIIGLGVLGTAAMFGRIRLHFVNGPLLLVRGLVGGIAVFLFFLSIAKLGVAKGTVISYAYPVFAGIFSAMFLHERLTVVKCLALVAAVFGIYLISARAGAAAGLLGFGVYELLAILGAVLSGVAVVTIKHLHHTDTSYTIFYSQCAIGMWLVIIPANLVPCSIGYVGGILLLGIGLTAAVAQLFMTEGYRFLSVTAGSLLCMLLPVFNLIVGVLLFQEPVSLRAIAGSVIVLLACAAAILPDRRPA